MFKTIGAFVKQWEADLAIALLRENGLHPADLQPFAHAGLGLGEAFGVMVPEEEADAAVALLEENGYGQNVVPDDEE